MTAAEQLMADSVAMVAQVRRMLEVTAAQQRAVGLDGAALETALAGLAPPVRQQIEQIRATYLRQARADVQPSLPRLRTSRLLV